MSMRVIERPVNEGEKTHTRRAVKKPSVLTIERRCSDGTCHQNPQTRSPSRNATGGDDARSSSCAGGAELLRPHRTKPASPYRLLHPVVQGARAVGAGRSDPARAGAVSAASLPLPQKERGAAELPVAALVSRAAARVVPMDDPAEPHPAQPGVRAGAATAGPCAAQEHLLRP